MSDACGAGDKSVTLRSARLARNTDGEPLGCGVFLDADDLAELGVDPDATDANRVAYHVEDGEFRVGVSGDSQ